MTHVKPRLTPPPGYRFQVMGSNNLGYWVWLLEPDRPLQERKTLGGLTFDATDGRGWMADVADEKGSPRYAKHNLATAEEALSWLLQEVAS